MWIAERRPLTLGMSSRTTRARGYRRAVPPAEAEAAALQRAELRAVQAARMRAYRAGESVGRYGPAPRAAHGTPGGYQRHRRHGETPCDACRAAHAADVRARRAWKSLDTRRGVRPWPASLNVSAPTDTRGTT